MKAVAIIALMLFATIPALPSSMALHGPESCSTSGSYAECRFHCHGGQRLRVSAVGTQGQLVEASASCGGVYINCSGYGSCSAEGTWQDGEGAGTCRTSYQDHSATCRSLTDTIGVFTVGTPSTSEVPISTPDRDKVCSPSEIVCIGPVESIYVATIPSQPGMGILNPTGVVVTHEGSGVADPTLHYTQVGPIIVTGPPVPITVCNTPCTLPSGIGNGAYLAVEVMVHGARYSMVLLS